MSKYFSKKHNYEIDPNQELFSYGMGNFLTSFFEGFPAGGGLTRSLIMESTGAKTQVFSIISSGIVLVVIVALLSVCDYVGWFVPTSDEIVFDLIVLS